ncbi:hypothetical protein [Cystobacter ferrugineus]|uniref:Lipoprotein n=1 Tax=Cystobacter ferrugineus TaxID=83449 RepID=A0A1L9B9X5_9BACT|nr:hypothetical protein [Cystobacter ferrugineus]OJH38993.1 hypothetical protein BON30_22590 [Cystobacter ferrugineus]
MNRCSWMLLTWLSLLMGCSSASTGADTRRYACTQDDECAAGYVCRAGMCQSEGEPLPPSGPPTRLDFASPAQTVGVGKCSAAVVLETRTAAGSASAVEADTNVVLSTQPSTGVKLYRDAACSDATEAVTVAAGSSRATFYFRSTVVRSVRITATASGFESVFQDENVVVEPTNLVFITSAQTLPAGGCSALVELEARDDGGKPLAFAGPTNVTLSGSGFSFFSDPSCTSPLAAAVFAEGATRASFYFKGKSGGTFPLSASVSGLPGVQRNQTILPAVRTGVCEMPADGLSVTCTISPAQLDLSKTMLFVSISPPGSSPDSSSVRCMLSARDAITCGRNERGTGKVYVVWHTVELPTGLKVQHLQPSCQTQSAIQVPIERVSPDNTFLLVTGEQSGKILGEDDYLIAKLSESYTRVDIQWPVPCGVGWKGSLQVVEAEGIRVTRGSGVTMTGTQTEATVVGLPAVDPATSVLLFTYQVTNAGTPNLCDRVLRGTLTSPTEISFSRGAGSSAGCTTAVINDISWERIDFGPRASVQTVPVTMNRGEYEAYPAISPVDVSRTVVFASGQGMNGQAGGESSYSGDDLISESLAGFELDSPSRLRIIRDSVEGRARWTSFVVQFEP